MKPIVRIQRDEYAVWFAYAEYAQPNRYLVSRDRAEEWANLERLYSIPTNQQPGGYDPTSNIPTGTDAPGAAD